jgi:hypothetical protein
MDPLKPLENYPFQDSSFWLPGQDGTKKKRSVNEELRVQVNCY